MDNQTKHFTQQYKNFSNSDKTRSYLGQTIVPLNLGVFYAFLSIFSQRRTQWGKGVLNPESKFELDTP